MNGFYRTPGFLDWATEDMVVFLTEKKSKFKKLLTVGLDMLHLMYVKEMLKGQKTKTLING